MTEDVSFAFERLLVARLARLAGETDEARRELAAHAVAAVRDSHVCLSPELYARRLGVASAVARDRLRGLEGSPLVRRVRFTDVLTDGAPFVLDEHERLYLARYFEHQQALASRVVALASRKESGPSREGRPLVDVLFPKLAGEGPDAQREAALAATTRSFTIVSGGPGTGKTSTVVKMLALLVDDALASGRSPPRTMLLAPTGKAAARLAESIRASRDRLAIPDSVRDGIPDVASTVHRALGVRPKGGFVRGPTRPLEADVVIVDEASMIDLALMRSLVDAIGPETRLVLLGDRDQLASVEAGSVLADLCDAAARSGSPLAGTVFELTFSHRFSAQSGIGALARAIRAGDAAEVFAVLADDLRTDVLLDEPIPHRGRLPATLQADAREGFSGLLGLDPSEQLAALGRFRVLTAHRVGSLGVTELGHRIARSIGRETEHSAHGTPILILENDERTGLANGDVGVVGESGVAGIARVAGEEVARTVYFAASSGPRAIGVGRLPKHEASWAMSIHKSQGSEFDVVSVVLPEGSSLASRELLYTAVTRARSAVRLHASRETLESCIGRRVVRASGLVDAIVALG